VKLIAEIRARDWSTVLLWAVYLALLGVLLPHTAWAFGQFEPGHLTGLGWIAAIAFEGAIAAFTWRLKELIEDTPNHKSVWKRFRRRYLNIYALGLLVAIGVSSLANWAHSVEYGRAFTVFDKYRIPPLLYTMAFGAILPACSLLFARILADVRDSDVEVSAEIAELKRANSGLRSELKAAERNLTRAEDAAKLLLQLTAEDKAQRILAASNQWPGLSQSALAHITGASPSYVSQVLTKESGCSASTVMRALKGESQ